MFRYLNIDLINDYPSLHNICVISISFIGVSSLRSTESIGLFGHIGIVSIAGLVGYLSAFCRTFNTFDRHCRSALQVGFYFTILPEILYICRSATHTRVSRCSFLTGRHAYPLPGADVGSGASSLATRARLCPPRLALTLSGDRT